MLSRMIFTLAGLLLGAIAASIVHADEVTCYKANGDIEYHAGSDYHSVRVSQSGKLVSVYFTKLTKQWGDDIKEEIALASFTNTPCTIKWGTKKGLWK